jgi:hypothetical protein
VFEIEIMKTASNHYQKSHILMAIANSTNNISKENSKQTSKERHEPSIYHVFSVPPGKSRQAAKLAHVATAAADVLARFSIAKARNPPSMLWSVTARPFSCVCEWFTTSLSSRLWSRTT